MLLALALTAHHPPTHPLHKCQICNNPWPLPIPHNCALTSLLCTPAPTPQMPDLHQSLTPSMTYGYALFLGSLLLLFSLYLTSPVFGDYSIWRFQYSDPDLITSWALNWRIWMFLRRREAINSSLGVVFEPGIYFFNSEINTMKIVKFWHPDPVELVAQTRVMVQIYIFFYAVELNKVPKMPIPY